MKVIEIKELKTVPTSVQTTSFEDFESIVSIAGHYTQTIDKDDLAEQYCTMLFNYLYDHMADIFEDEFKGNDAEEVMPDVEDVMSETLSEIVDEADIPDDLATYTNDVYIELDSNCARSLCYIKDNTPDFSSTYETYYLEHAAELEQALRAAFKAQQAELEENARQRAVIENEKSHLFAEARAKYQTATTATERNKIVSELRIELGQRYGDKMTKDEITFKLVH